MLPESPDCSSFPAEREGFSARLHAAGYAKHYAYSLSFSFGMLRHLLVFLIVFSSGWTKYIKGKLM